MQYKIPQNVGIEDKIVGPLTLRQLIILAAGIGASYVLFAVLNKIYELNVLEYIIIALPALLSAAFALVRINDIPLLKYFFLFLEFSIKPQKRIWNHLGISSLVAPELIEIKKESETQEDSLLEIKAKKAANLRELTKTLDSGGFEHLREIGHEDVDEARDDDLVTQAYFGYKRNESATENMYWRTTDAHKKMLDVFARMPIARLKEGSKEAEAAKQEIARVKQEVSDLKKTSQQSRPAQKSPAPQPSRPMQPKPSVLNPEPPKTPKPVQKPLSGPPAVTGSPGGPSAEENTKKRPNKRKRNLPKPVRQGNINNMNKNKPAEYIEKAPQSPSQLKPTAPRKTGQFDIRDLESGGIVINLD